MFRRNWIGLFPNNQSSDLSNELERGYEAALLIQSLELEFYNDRPIRPDLELSVPRSVQATILRRFRTALSICRSTCETVRANRGQLDYQELRQFQLIEGVVSRYATTRQNSNPTLSRAPDPLPRSLLGVFDSIRRQLDPLLGGDSGRRIPSPPGFHLDLPADPAAARSRSSSGAAGFTNLCGLTACGSTGPSMCLSSITPSRILKSRRLNNWRVFKAELEFNALVNGDELPSDDELRVILQHRAIELKDEASVESLHAIKNVLADFLGLIAFVVLCLLSRDELRVLRGFLDEAVYGLSDSAKAFGIILFTDIFVGYHSPEGWAVLLEGIAEHFGLPARQNFIMMFIATFCDFGDHFQVLDFPLSQPRVSIVCCNVEG